MGFLNGFQTIRNFSDDLQLLMSEKRQTDEAPPRLVIVNYENPGDWSTHRADAFHLAKPTLPMGVCTRKNDEASTPRTGDEAARARLARWNYTILRGKPRVVTRCIGPARTLRRRGNGAEPTPDYFFLQLISLL